MNVPEVTRERVLTTDQNGDFSRRVIDALFRVATMDWSRIFAVLHETIYLQPTVKVPSSCYQLFGHSAPFSGGRGRSSRATWSHTDLPQIISPHISYMKVIPLDPAWKVVQYKSELRWSICVARQKG